MKLIETFKSPNFNERKSSQNFDYLIIHYTAMKSCFEALEYMCEKKNKVSAHFLVSKNGDIFYLVDINKRAWHAGESYWKGLEDLNSSSIGIEIDNSGHHIYNEGYNHLQIESLCELIKKLSEDYNILSKNILGHSDIAPFRKIDPGEKFPWQKLNQKKLSYFPKMNTKNIEHESNKAEKNNEYRDSQYAISMLDSIGYDTRNVGLNDNKFKLLIEAYQRHYRQSNITGEIDRETIILIKQHYKDMLT